MSKVSTGDANKLTALYAVEIQLDGQAIEIESI